MGQVSGYVMEARRSPSIMLQQGGPHSAVSDLVNNIEQMPQNRPHTQDPTASADSERLDGGAEISTVKDKAKHAGF